LRNRHVRFIIKSRNYEILTRDLPILGKQIAVALAVAGLLMPLPASMAAEKARPKPPPEAVRAFQALEEVEEGLERGEWKRALQASRSLQGLFPSIIGGLPGETDPGIFYRFGYALGKFQGAVLAEDRWESEEYYTDLHQICLQLAGRFDFPVPPGLDCIGRYLVDAERFLAEGRYGEIIFEMKEVGVYFRDLYDLLRRLGVEESDLLAFHLQINQVMAAAEARSEKVTARSLRELRERTEKYIDLSLHGEITEVKPSR
jgi:hypothetical protein